MTNTDDGRPSYAAGWYADVNAPGTERWYDGNAWTEHVRPAPTAVAPGAPAEVLTSAVPVGSAPNGQPSGSGAPSPNARWYKRKGIMIPVGVVGGIIVISAIGSSIGGGGSSDPTADTNDQPVASQAPDTVVQEEPEAEVETEPVLVEVPNVVGMTGTEAQSALSALGFQVETGGGDDAMPVTAQDVAAGTQAEEGAAVTLTLQEKPKTTLAQVNALGAAEDYLEFMPFSRAGLIEQLTSEYGSGYELADAEFAVSALEETGKVDWNVEAAEAAQSYLDTMSFSRSGLYEQLTSEYGAGFTPEQANAGLAAVGY